MNANNTLNGQSRLFDFLYMLPVIVFSAFSVLAVRLHIYTRPMSQFYWTSDTDNSQLSDSFAYCKMVLITAGSVLALVMLAVAAARGDFDFKKLRLTKPYICMLVYSAFAVLSYIFCNYKEFSLLGYNERFEGLIVLLCYMFMLFYIMNMADSPRRIRIVLWGLFVSLSIGLVIGCFQAAANDPFKTAFVQKLITPNMLLTDGRTSWQAIDELIAAGDNSFSFNFPPGAVYMTLFNINYVSMYICLLLPVLAMLFIRSFDRASVLSSAKTGDKASRIALGAAMLILFGLSLYNLICSNSASAYVGLAVILVSALALLGRNIKRWALPLSVILAVSAGILVKTSDRWLKEVGNTLNSGAETAVELVFRDAYADGDTAANVQKELTAADFPNSPASIKPVLDYMFTEERGFGISYNGHLLHIYTKSGNALGAYDENDEPVRIERTEGGNYIFLDERFHDYTYMSLLTDDEGYLYVRMHHSRNFDFRFMEDGTYFVTPYIRLTQVPKYEISGLIKDLSFGTSRGYIWSRSLPLLKHHILLGSGPDTFCMEFPQYDYAGKYTWMQPWYWQIIVDKPHNMYIQTGINTGCVSLFALLALFFFYSKDALDAGYDFSEKARPDSVSYIGAGIFLGVWAFLAVAMFNDSSVSTAPTFWTLLGLGFACSKLIRSEKEVFSDEEKQDA